MIYTITLKMKLIYGLLITLSIVDVLNGAEKPTGPPGAVTQRDPASAEQVPRCPEVSIPGIIKGGGKGGKSDTGKGRDASLRRRGYTGSCIVKHSQDIRNVVELKRAAKVSNANVIAYCKCNDKPSTKPRGGSTKAKRGKGGDKEALIPKDPKVNPKALTKGGCTILRHKRSSALINDQWCCACSYEPIPPWLPPVATPEPEFPFPMFPRLPPMPPISGTMVGRRKRSVAMEAMDTLPQGQIRRDSKINSKPSIRF